MKNWAFLILEGSAEVSVNMLLAVNRERVERGFYFVGKIHTWTLFVKKTDNIFLENVKIIGLIILENVKIITS